MLEGAVERHVVGSQYGDVPLGLYVIRGENVVLLGQVDEEKDAKTTSELLQRVEIDEILEAKKAQEDERKLKASLCRHMNKSAETWDFDI